MIDTKSDANPVSPEEIRGLREGMGLSRWMFAVRMADFGSAVSPGAVEQWERGESKPSLDSVLALYRMAGKPLAPLTDGDGPRGLARKRTTRETGDTRVYAQGNGHRSTSEESVSVSAA